MRSRLDRKIQTRDMVLGLSDGLTVPFALTAGVAGAVHSSPIVLIAGFAELAAGAISMGLGGYLAGHSEVEVYVRAREREHLEVLEVPAEERREVTDILESYGLSGRPLEEAVDALTAQEETWVSFMMREELGLEEPERGHGLRSGITIGLSYVTSGILPLLPYLLPVAVGTALLLSALLTVGVLTVFGWYKGHLTGQPTTQSVVQTVLLGGAAAAVSFAVARGIATVH